MNDTTQDVSPAQPLRFTRDLRVLADDAEALLRHAVQDAGQGYAEARTRLERSVTQARERLAAADEAARGRARDAGDAVDRYVHDNPWRAICLGAAAGLLAGVLATRR